MPELDPTLIALDRALQASGMRQQSIANNIANVNTPGFKRSDVSFDGVLEEALGNGASNEELQSLSPEVSVDSSTTMRVDGNNVDIDREMANLAENNIRYNALVQIAAKRMSTLKNLIQETR